MQSIIQKYTSQLSRKGNALSRSLKKYNSLSNHFSVLRWHTNSSPIPFLQRNHYQLQRTFIPCLSICSYNQRNTSKRCLTSSIHQQTESTTDPSQSDSWVSSLSLSIPGHSSTVDPFRLVSSDLDIMTSSIKSTVSVLQHPVLDSAASHLLSLHGKRFRPIMVILMAHSTAMLTAATCGAPVPSNSVLPSQLRLAEITELIHAASLLHDDVIDIAETRRGALSVNSLFGNQLAVLAGDFLLARASVALARLRDCDVVELLSTVIEHLVRGEVIQMNGGVQASNGKLGGIGDVNDIEASENWYHHPRTRFDAYLAKSFFKTASLIANSCRAVTMLAGHAEQIAEAAYQYGENVGMAFQLIDDLLDMTGKADILGKPVLNDLKQGHATAPVLFALEQFPHIQEMVDRKFKGDGDIEETVRLVEEADGLTKTRELAIEHARNAVEAIVQVLPPSEHRSALVNLANFVVTRER